MIVLILIRLLDLLVDAFYLLAWAALNSALNWLLRSSFKWLGDRGISLSPSKLVWGFYWISQALFALSTLAVIVLYATKDIKNLRTRQHGGFAEVGMKFVHMGKHTSALAVWSTLLIGWTLIDLIVEKAFVAFSGNDASVLTHPWSVASELVFAAVTFCYFAKPMYDSTTEVYRRLFKDSRT